MVAVPLFPPLHETAVVDPVLVSSDGCDMFTVVIAEHPLASVMI